MPIHFHSKNPETSWLSNLSGHGFVLDEVKWRSVEHYYQAAKYQDAAAVKRVSEAKTPFDARKAGQDRSLVVRGDWEDVKMAVMRRALDAKFSQNRTLRGMLVASGEKDLVHESGSDRFWGRDREGIGENRLGVMLMGVRASLGK